MEMVENPFSPAAGAPAAELARREDAITTDL